MCVLPNGGCGVGVRGTPQAPDKPTLQTINLNLTAAERNRCFKPLSTQASTQDAHAAQPDTQNRQKQTTHMVAASCSLSP